MTTTTTETYLRTELTGAKRRLRLATAEKDEAAIEAANNEIASLRHALDTAKD